jgi:polyhydroxybutyrate depolymerase
MGKDPGWDCMSVPQYIEKWRKMEDCAPQAQTTYQHGAVTCITYASCAQGSEVTLCTIEGSGHTWPGGQYHNNSQFWKKAVGSITYDISANEAMWDFFQKHPLP